MVPFCQFKVQRNKNFKYSWSNIQKYYKARFQGYFTCSINYPVALSNYVHCNNPVLNDATAWNYDISLSFLHPIIGLVTISGFFKNIRDLVVYMPNYKPVQDTGILAGAPADFTDRLNGGPHNYLTAYVKSDSPFTSYTQPGFPLNNPSPATIKGIEFAWQTNLSYLPGLLKGIVFEINYAIIRSYTNYP